MIKFGSRSYTQFAIGAAGFSQERVTARLVVVSIILLYTLLLLDRSLTKTLAEDATQDALQRHAQAAAEVQNNLGLACYIFIFKGNSNLPRSIFKAL